MKKISIIFTLLVIGVAVYAQSKISSVFVTLPEHFLIGVTADQRNELTSVSADTNSVVVHSSINEDIERVTISDDYIAIKTSDSGLLQVKLLPLVNNTDIVAVVTTVCGPACDSRIDFYTTSWEPLDQASLFPEKSKDWFLNNSADRNSEEVKNAYAALDMTPISFLFAADTKDLTAKYNIKDYLSADDYKLLEPYLLKDPKVFKWDKTSYK